METFVVFDLETTGLSAAHASEVLEIGACKIADGEVIETYHKYIKPWKKIPKKITELTGIDDKMVEHADNKFKVLPDFRDFIGDAIPVAHNAEFDINFLNICFYKQNIPFINQYICTMKSYKKFVNPKLGKLGLIAEAEGIDLKNAHTALADATATAELFIKLLNQKQYYVIEHTEKETIQNVFSRISASSLNAVINEKFIEQNVVELYPEGDKNQILKLLKQRKNPQQISEELRCSLSSVCNVFKDWINPLRATKYYSYQNDTKANNQMKLMVSICETYDELLSMHKCIFGKGSEPNYIYYALSWGLARNNYTFEYEDFLWHFQQHKTIEALSKEFNIECSIILPFMKRYIEETKSSERSWIKTQICKKSDLKKALSCTEPESLPVKVQLTLMLWNDKFFAIETI